MIATVLFIVAAVLSVVEIVRSRGQDLVAWAALAITAGLLLGRLS